MALCAARREYRQVYWWWESPFGSVVSDPWRPVTDYSICVPPISRHRSDLGPATEGPAGGYAWWWRGWGNLITGFGKGGKVCEDHWGQGTIALHFQRWEHFCYWARRTPRRSSAGRSRTYFGADGGVGGTPGGTALSVGGTPLSVIGVVLRVVCTNCVEWAPNVAPPPAPRFER